MAKVEQKNNYITVRDGEKGKTYRVRIRLQGKYFSETFKTEKEAKQCVITKLAESQKGDDIANLKKFKRTTIHDVVDQYLNYLDKPDSLKNLKAQKSKETPNKSKIYILRNIKRDFSEAKDVTIDSFKANVLKNYIEIKLDKDIPDQKRAEVKTALYKGYMVEDEDGNLVRRKYSEGTVRHYYFALKAAIKHFYTVNGIKFDSDVFDQVEAPRAWSNPSERVLKEGELERLVVACEKLYVKKEESKALIKFLSMSATRVQETLLMEWKHIQLNPDNPSESYILIPKKNQKNRNFKDSFDRSIPLRPGFFEFVRDELMKIKKDGQKYVFGHYWTQSTIIAKKLKILCKNAGIVETLTPHSFRHTSITWYFKNTNLTQIEISKISGHLELNVLNRYLNYEKTTLGEKLWLNQKIPTIKKITKAAKPRSK